MKIPVKKLHPDAKLPVYATNGAAGADLHALEDAIVPAWGHRLVQTGLAFAIPTGWEVQIRPRSGLAFKNMVSVLNTPGTIDSDYRGDIGVILVNHGSEHFTVKAGDRIAQMVVAPVYQAAFDVVDELPETERGEGGFGSTG